MAKFVSDGLFRCPDCGEVKSRDGFVFDKGKSYEVSTYCRDCRYKRKLEWQKRNREHYLMKKRERMAKYREENRVVYHRKCASCGCDFETTNSRKKYCGDPCDWRSVAYTPVEPSAKYCAKCGVFIERITGPEYRVCDSCKDWHKKVQSREYMRRQRANMTEEEKAESMRRIQEWRKENPERADYKDRLIRYMCKVRREHRKKNLPATLTTREWRDTLEGTGGKCVYCGKPWEHQDHFVPLSKGGGYTALNIVPACAECNVQKGDRMPFEYIKNYVMAG